MYCTVRKIAPRHLRFPPQTKIICFIPILSTTVNFVRRKFYAIQRCLSLIKNEVDYFHISFFHFLPILFPFVLGSHNELTWDTLRSILLQVEWHSIQDWVASSLETSYTLWSSLEILNTSVTFSQARPPASTYLSIHIIIYIQDSVDKYALGTSR